jgi:hypothetical protein
MNEVMIMTTRRLYEVSIRRSNSDTWRDFCVEAPDDVSAVREAVQQIWPRAEAEDHGGAGYEIWESTRDVQTQSSRRLASDVRILVSHAESADGRRVIQAD